MECSIHSFSQQKRRFVLDKNSIVKDSSGRQYKFEEWMPLIQNREYTAAPVDPNDEKTSFILKAVTPEMRERMLKNSPRPRESTFFKTGEKFAPFKARTIDGEKINIKDLKGKILVINYWFINCAPCRKEIPELNELVSDFQSDTSVVFISIAKDPNRDLKDFLKSTPFSYKVIGFNVGGNGITSFPTNVVVDKAGNVAFHSTGYSNASVHWIRKTIEELKSAQ
jgi:thiol-disulfide isomerase/thioredoxin